MWGVLAGKVLRSSRAPYRKIGILLAFGLAAVAAGYVLDPLTPIVKRICTSSFVIVSGGWCLTALAVSYWLIDVKGLRRWGWFFNVVGMNSLFIYLFTHTGGAYWLEQVVKPFTWGITVWAGADWPPAVTSLAVWALLWCVCYWLYRNRILIKV
jgi:predicted acyltransferase